MKNKNGYVSVSGSEIYYELSGNHDGKPLLMLHGGLGSLNELSSIHKYVAADYQLISIDFRGHGKSLLGDRPLNYMQYQQDVQHVLSHLGIDKYSILVLVAGVTLVYGLKLGGQQAELQ